MTGHHLIATRMAELLRSALEEDELTQAEFARRCGVTEKHVSQVLHGKATARYAQLDYWAFVLGREWHVDLVPVDHARRQDLS